VTFFWGGGVDISIILFVHLCCLSSVIKKIKIKK
jgi:hypothetical protein